MAPWTSATFIPESTHVYSKLYERLALSTTTPEYSQAISMEGYNAALVEVVTYVYGAAASIGIQVQISNDLENWSNAPTGGTATVTSVGYATASVATGIAATYIRVKVTSAAAVVSILSLGANISAQ
jgi:hypothetical protein